MSWNTPHGPRRAKGIKVGPRPERSADNSDHDNGNSEKARAVRLRGSGCALPKQGRRSPSRGLCPRSVSGALAFLGLRPPCRPCTPGRPGRAWSSPAAPAEPNSRLQRVWFSFSAPMFDCQEGEVLRAPSARVETWTASSSSAPFLWEAPGHIHLLRKNPRSRSLVVGAAGELVLAQLDVPHLAVLDGLSEGLAHGPLAAHGLELLEIPRRSR